MKLKRNIDTQYEEDLVDFMLQQMSSVQTNIIWYVYPTKRIIRCRSEISFSFQQQASYLLLQEKKAGAVCWTSTEGKSSLPNPLPLKISSTHFVGEETAEEAIGYLLNGLVAVQRGWSLWDRESATQFTWRVNVRDVSWGGWEIL